jgi:hypothetical protein
MKSADEIAQWREGYRALSRELARIRARELREMSNEAALAKIFSLAAAGEPWRSRREWSGLVEQQAVFHRKKKK